MQRTVMPAVRLPPWAATHYNILEISVDIEQEDALSTETLSDLPNIKGIFYFVPEPANILW